MKATIAVIKGSKNVDIRFSSGENVLKIQHISNEIIGKKILEENLMNSRQQ